MNSPQGWPEGRINQKDETERGLARQTEISDRNHPATNPADLLKVESRGKRFQWACFLSIEEGEKKGEEDAPYLKSCHAPGEHTAFWSLWEGHQKYLYSVCLRQMGGKAEDAEDALSISLLKALDKLPAHAGKITNPRGWLTRLTYNVCIDIHRERRRRTKRNEKIEDLLLCGNFPSPWFHESPEEEVLHSEMYSQLCRAVEDLPAQLREPFVLRFFKDTSYPDIAISLSLSTENVRKRIQKARAILKGKLDAYHSSNFATSVNPHASMDFVPGGKSRFLPRPPHEFSSAGLHCRQSSS